MAHTGKPDAMEHLQDTTRWVVWEDFWGTGKDLQLTHYMMLELMAAAMILLIFVPLCRRARDGSLPKGRWWNAMEAVLIFVRDKIVQPALGEKHTAGFFRVDRCFDRDGVGAASDVGCHGFRDF